MRMKRTLNISFLLMVILNLFSWLHRDESQQDYWQDAEWGLT